jgi:hypothetical protein
MAIVAISLLGHIYQWQGCGFIANGVAPQDYKHKLQEWFLDCFYMIAVGEILSTSGA